MEVVEYLPSVAVQMVARIRSTGKNISSSEKSILMKDKKNRLCDFVYISIQNFVNISLLAMINNT